MIKDNKKLDSVKFMCKLFLLNFLFVLPITNYQPIGAISCVLKNGARGECILLNNCPSAIYHLQHSTTLEYCNYELDEVCCEDNNKEEFISQDVFSNERDSQIDGEELQNDDLDRSKHSIGNAGVGRNGRRRNNNQNFAEETGDFEKNSNNFYIPKNKQRQRPYHPHNFFTSGLSDENYFLPPGLAKKKNWNNEKTNVDNYYNGFATKKPNRNQNHINFNRPHYVEENNPHKWEYERTTKRNNEGSNWHFPQTDFPNYNAQKTTKQNQWSQQSTTRRTHGSQETTTRRNQWNQQTTTRRNFGSVPSGNQPGNYYGENERPNRPISEQQRPLPERPNRPTLEQQRPLPERPNRPTFEQQRPLPERPNYPNYKPPSQERKRKSEIMCIEYSKEITKNITGLPLTTNPNPVTIPVRKCIQAQQLIVGGENTTIGEFPHMAAVGFRDRNNQGVAWNCGGTLISDQFVLTAAHCASTNLGRPIKVRLGAHNLKKNYNEVRFVDYSVVDIITHPEYKPPSKYNDIALLKLSNRVTFYEHVRPACLNIDDTLSASKAIATGWGKMAYDGNVSEILLKVVLNIVDNNTCNRLYKINGKTAVLSRGIVDSQLCAGEFSGGKDTCQGDSGGPLSITNTKCIHHIIGVTSFGKGCAQANTAGVYTRVSAFVPWIESVVWP